MKCPERRWREKVQQAVKLLGHVMSWKDVLRKAMKLVPVDFEPCEPGATLVLLLGSLLPALGSLLGSLKLLV